MSAIASRLRAEIESRLREEAAPVSFQHALFVFLDLAVEQRTLRELKTLCVLVPEICLSTSTSLYIQDKNGMFRLHRSSVPMDIARQMAFSPPPCAKTALHQNGNTTLFPLPNPEEDSVLGLLCVHRHVRAEEERFYQHYADRVGRVLVARQLALKNRSRLNFINNLVRDIGHNIIVPNMHFKLLFLRLDDALADFGNSVNSLTRGCRPESSRQIQAGVRALRDQLASISRRFHQSSIFLESLLRRSHFEKGRYDLHVTPCKFKSQIIEPQLERFRELFAEQGVQVRIDDNVRIDEDILLPADLGLMSQVFANLLSNAVKYTRPGEGPSSAKEMIYGWETMPTAFGQTKPGVRIFISTTGPPVPSPEQDKLFDFEFRAPSVAAVAGSGHGLFFVKQIVDLHGGRVRYHRENRRNVFSLLLPLAPRNHHALDAPPCPRPS